MYVCPSGGWNVPHRREGERLGTHPATSSMAPGKPKGTLSCWLSWVDIRLGMESQCRVSQGSWALPGEERAATVQDLVTEGRAPARPPPGSPFLEDGPGEKQHFQ